MTTHVKLLGLLYLFLSATTALACPNFSGSFVAIYDGEEVGIPYTLMQTGCELLTISPHGNFPHVPKTWVLDGQFYANPWAEDTWDAAGWEGDCLLSRSRIKIYVGDNGNTTIWESSRTFTCLTAERDLLLHWRMLDYEGNIRQQGTSFDRRLP